MFGLVDDLQESERERKAWQNEAAKLRDAIRRYGLSVMQTSGDWSLHDMGVVAAAEQARVDAIVNQNIDLLAVVKKVVEWNRKYPSSRVFSHSEIVAIAKEMDEINDAALEALGEPLTK